MGTPPSTNRESGVIFFFSVSKYLIDKELSSAQNNLPCFFRCFMFACIRSEMGRGERIRVEGCSFAIVMSITLTLLCFIIRSNHG